VPVDTTAEHTFNSAELIMAYGVIHFFPGGTQSQYDKTVGEVHPASGGLPLGQLFHAAGASDGG
jgi:hypothetical protein